MLAEAFRFFTWHFPLLNGKSGCIIFHIWNLTLQILVCPKAVRCLQNVGSWRFYRSLLFLFIDDKLSIVGRILQLFKSIASLFALRYFCRIVLGESSGDWQSFCCSPWNIRGHLLKDVRHLLRIPHSCFWFSNGSHCNSVPIWRQNYLSSVSNDRSTQFSEKLRMLLHGNLLVNN